MERAGNGESNLGGQVAGAFPGNGVASGWQNGEGRVHMVGETFPCREGGSPGAPPLLLVETGCSEKSPRFLAVRSIKDGKFG